MMLPKIYCLIGKEKGIDGMDMNLKCINKLLNNLKTLMISEKEEKRKRDKMM